MGRLLVMLAMLAAPLTAQDTLALRVTADTRDITRILWDTAAHRIATELLDRYAPDEGPLCLYGGRFASSVDGEPILAIALVADPTEIVEQDSTHVNFICPRTEYYIGTLHTHPQHRPETPYACIPSGLNMHQLMWDDDTLLEMIFCADGTGYGQLKDGRWWWFGWNDGGIAKLKEMFGEP